MQIKRQLIELTIQKMSRMSKLANNIKDTIILHTKHQNIIGGIGSYHWWASFLSNAENIYFPIHNKGWGVDATAYEIEHNQIPDLHLPFVNYIHHSLYL